MNCHECRKHLYPFLDSELEVKENLSVLEHLDACPACHQIFSGEEQGWLRVRSVMRAERVDPALRARIPEMLARSDRFRTWRRTGLFLLPAGLVAAAALVIFFFNLSRGFRHSIVDHGQGVEFAVSTFLGLEDESIDRGRTIIDPDLLREVAIAYDVLAGPELESFYRALFGPGSRIPDALREESVRAAALKVDFRGSTVSNLILSLRDRSVGVYHLDRKKAALLDLHLVEEGTRTGLRIERCRGCHVVAVTRGDDVFILVSRQGIEPLLHLVQQTF